MRRFPSIAADDQQFGNQNPDFEILSKTPYPHALTDMHVYMNLPPLNIQSQSLLTIALPVGNITQSVHASPILYQCKRYHSQ